MGDPAEAAPPPKPPPPPPLQANDEAAVQEMFRTGYYYFPSPPFWDGQSIWSVDRGTRCLWRGVAKGLHGGESTRTEFFHGVCQDVFGVVALEACKAEVFWLFTKTIYTNTDMYACVYVHTTPT